MSIMARSNGVAYGVSQAWQRHPPCNSGRRSDGISMAYRSGMYRNSASVSCMRIRRNGETRAAGRAWRHQHQYQRNGGSMKMAKLMV